MSFFLPLINVQVCCVQSGVSTSDSFSLFESFSPALYVQV